LTITVKPPDKGGSAFALFSCKNLPGYFGSFNSWVQSSLVRSASLFFRVQLALFRSTVTFGVGAMMPGSFSNALLGLLVGKGGASGRVAKWTRRWP